MSEARLLARAVTRHGCWWATSTSTCAATCAARSGDHRLLLLRQRQCRPLGALGSAAASFSSSNGADGGGGGGSGGGGRGGLLPFLAGAAVGSLASSLWGQTGGSGSGGGSGSVGGGDSGGRASTWSDRIDAAEGARDRLAQAAGALGTAFMNAGIGGKFAMLIGCTLPAVAVGSAALKAHVPGLTWPGAAMRIFSLVFRIPPPMPNEVTAGAHAVTHATFLAGFFAFALILSVVNEAVQRHLAFIRGGSLPVTCDDHLLLLGVNDTTVPMLQQIARPPGVAKGGWPGSVVILTGDQLPKPELDERLRQELFDKGYSLDVHTREGVAFKAADLAHAGAHRARHIILLAGQDPTAPATEALSAAAAMSLATLRARPGQSIVVQVPGVVKSGAEVLLGLASSAGLASVHSRFRALETPGSMFVSRLIAQAAVEPGTLRCWTELLDPADGSPQLRALPPGAVAGATYGEARARCEHIAVGIVRGGRVADIAGGSGGAGGKRGGGSRRASRGGGGSCDSGGNGVVVSPPDDTPLGPHDRLIVLTRSSGGSGGSDDSGSFEDQQQAAAAAARARLARNRKSRWLGVGGGASGGGKGPRRILVVGWPSAELQTLLEGLETFGGDSGALVTVVSPDAPPPHLRDDEDGEQRRRRSWWRWGASSLRRWVVSIGGGGGGSRGVVRFVHSADPLSLATLASAGIADCDAIVVGAAQQRPASAQLGSAGAAAPQQHRQQHQHKQQQQQQQQQHASDAAARSQDDSPLVRDAHVMHALLSLQRALLASGRRTAPHVVAPVSALASAELARDFFAAMQAEAATAATAATAAAAAAGAPAATTRTSSSSTTTTTTTTSSSSSSPRESCGMLGPAYLDFLKPNGIVAALLLQESLDDAYSRLMRELLWSAEGHELYLRRPDELGVEPGEEVAFGELAEAARLTKCWTALGVVRRSGGAEEVLLAPHPSQRIRLEAGDRVLVIAED